MTDALANLMKLPEWCYGLLNEQPVVISRGAREAQPVAIRVKTIDATNLNMGVTRHQRLAMEAGVTFGWNSEAADPDTHATATGDEPLTRHTYTIVYPVQHVVRVSAYDETQALRQAEIVHDDGQFEVLSDGQPYIIDIKD